MTVGKVSPQMLQMGDTIVLNQQPVVVKYVDGPDNHGTYDVYTVDESGNPHQTIITDTVTLVV